MRLLEDELGVALFERRSRRVFPDRCRPHAGAGRGQWAGSDAAGRRRVARHPPGRRWVLSCEPTLLMRWLIPRWPDFQARHPGIDVPGRRGRAVLLRQRHRPAIRRDDFPGPGYHAEPLFAEKVGPVCRPDKVAAWFTTKAGAALKAGAPRLHTRTRPGAWPEWAAAADQPAPDAPGQTFDHFYFSLQAAVAGLVWRSARGIWHATIWTAACWPRRWVSWRTARAIACCRRGPCSPIARRPICWHGCGPWHSRNRAQQKGPKPLGQIRPRSANDAVVPPATMT
ncbi:LysR substrate-binding domain-containing protein [Serratia ureilytica]